MAVQDILLSFVGNRDPYGQDQELGPVLSLLGAREFSQVVLFCNGSAYVERARMVEEAARAEGAGPRFNFVSIDLESPIDYQEIFTELRRAVDQLTSRMDHVPHKFSILLDPGTPQMQTAWFLLVTSGHLEADLLQGVPPRFAGGAYKVRTVDLEGGAFSGLEIRETGAAHTPIRWSREEAASAAVAPAGGPSDQPTGQWITGSHPEVVGANPSFRSVLEKALQVSQYDISIVIRGETGTGKEVLARLIHESSPRKDKPFVAVNCAAVASNIAESELFGHKKGAFTGADKDRLGQFRAADGGTIFLDEVGDLAIETQAKLLRVLEDGTLTPVGSDDVVKTSVRVIAATNRDLTASVAEGSFRRDLYERLAQITLEIPPLRERTDDIPLFLKHFVDRWNARYGEEKGLSAESVDILTRYPWPGNVRQLRNAVESMCATGRSPAIGPELLPLDLRRYFNRDSGSVEIPTELPADGLDLKALLTNIEKSYYEEALERTGGNAEKAAKLLGVQGPAFRKAARERLGLRYRGEES